MTARGAGGKLGAFVAIAARTIAGANEREEHPMPKAKKPVMTPVTPVAGAGAAVGAVKGGAAAPSDQLTSELEQTEEYIRDAKDGG